MGTPSVGTRPLRPSGPFSQRPLPACCPSSAVKLPGGISHPVPLPRRNGGDGRQRCHLPAGDTFEESTLRGVRVGLKTSFLPSVAVSRLTFS